MYAIYNNKWIPKGALEILRGTNGRILDVGGGVAPYAGAAYIIDLRPFAAETLRHNAWGSYTGPAKDWSPDDYLQMDLCDNIRFPFDDDSFDLGLASHCLEDLRDPKHAISELSRVCKRVLIVTPSRLLEQTVGIEHPRYCGFCHHPWMFYYKDNTVFFRRKTPIVMVPGCHIKCPFGKTLKVEYGASFFHGAKIDSREIVFWSEIQDRDDYRDFIDSVRDKRVFEPDGRNHGPRARMAYWKRRLLGTI